MAGVFKVIVCVVSETAYYAVLYHCNFMFLLPFGVINVDNDGDEMIITFPYFFHV